jgi:hypothetical protein
MAPNRRPYPFVATHLATFEGGKPPQPVVVVDDDKAFTKKEWDDLIASPGIVFDAATKQWYLDGDQRVIVRPYQ